MNDFRHSTMKYMGFNEKKTADLLNSFMDEIANENLDNMAFQREYNDDRETKPSFDQISPRRIQDELSKDISIIKHFEVLLNDRMTAQSLYVSSISPKIRKPTDILLLSNAGINTTIDTLYNYLDLDVAQVKQQQEFYELRKDLRDLRHDAKERLAEYIRDMGVVEKEVLAAEKKLHKSKEALDYKIQAKLKADAAMHGTYNQSSAGSIGSNGGLSRQNSRSQSSSFTTTRSGQLSTTATLTGHNSIPKEFDDGLIRCEQDLQDDIKWLLRATHQYDQVMSASRRAHQRLSSECKRKIEEVIGKFIAQERICEVGRREALDQLERSLGNWSIESDITAFIKEHSDNDMNESLVLSSQALSILTDTVTRTTMPISISPGPLLAPISRQVSGQTINVRSSSPIKPSSSWNTTAAAAASTKVDDEYYHTSGDERAVSVDTASVSSTHVSSSQDTISNMGDSASKPTGSKWEALMSFQYFTPKYSKQKAGSANIVTPTPIATTPPATSTDTSINTSVCDKNSKSATSSLLHSTLLRSTLLPLSENDSETASVQGTEMGTYPTAIITSSEDGNDEVSNAVSTNLITSAPASPNKERHSPTKRLSKVLDEERIALATYSQRSHSGEGVGTHSLRTTPPYLLPAKDSATINKDGLSNIEPNSQNSVSPMVVYALEEDSFDLQALAAAVDTHLSTIFFAVIEETAVATSTATAAATQVITQDSSTKKSAISPRDTNTGRNSTSASANVPTITLTKQRKNSLNSSKTDSQKATSQKSVTSSNSQKSTVENTYPAHIQSAVTELCNLLQTTFGRDKFAQGLNQFRSRKVELSVGFEPLGDVLYHALSLCEVHHDVHCAKVIMMLSQTFYRDQLESFIPSQTSTLDTSSVPTSPMQRIKPKESSSLSSSIHSAKSPKSPLISQKDEMQMKTQRQQRNESISSEPSTARSIHLQERSSRVYLKEILVDHPIWKKKEFWEQILWDCVLDQMERIPYEQPWYELTREDRINCVRRVHEVVFSQVMAITHSMMEFGCPVQNVRDFLYRVCTVHQLGEGHRQHLWAHLKAFIDKHHGIDSSPVYEGTMRFY